MIQSFEQYVVERAGVSAAELSPSDRIALNTAFAQERSTGKYSPVPNVFISMCWFGVFNHFLFFLDDFMIVIVIFYEIFILFLLFPISVVIVSAYTCFVLCFNDLFFISRNFQQASI